MIDETKSNKEIEEVLKKNSDITLEETKKIKPF